MRQVCRHTGTGQRKISPARPLGQAACQACTRSARPSSNSTFPHLYTPLHPCVAVGGEMRRAADAGLGLRVGAVCVRLSFARWADRGLRLVTPTPGEEGMLDAGRAQWDRQTIRWLSQAALATPVSVCSLPALPPLRACSAQPDSLQALRSELCGLCFGNRHKIWSIELDGESAKAETGKHNVC